MQTGVQLVHEIVEALNRGDVDGMLARMDPDFEWRPLESSPAAGGAYRGHEQVRRYVEDWLATFDDLRLELRGGDWDGGVHHPRAGPCRGAIGPVRSVRHTPHHTNRCSRTRGQEMTCDEELAGLSTEGLERTIAEL